MAAARCHNKNNEDVYDRPDPASSFARAARRRHQFPRLRRQRRGRRAPHQARPAVPLRFPRAADGKRLRLSRRRAGALGAGLPRCRRGAGQAGYSVEWRRLSPCAGQPAEQRSQRKPGEAHQRDAGRLRRPRVHAGAVSPPAVRQCGLSAAGATVEQSWRRRHRAALRGRQGSHRVGSALVLFALGPTKRRCWKTIC